MFLFFFFQALSNSNPSLCIYFFIIMFFIRFQTDGFKLMLYGMYKRNRKNNTILYLFTTGMSSDSGRRSAFAMQRRYFIWIDSHFQCRHRWCFVYYQHTDHVHKTEKCVCILKLMTVSLINIIKHVKMIRLKSKIYYILRFRNN